MMMRAQTEILFFRWVTLMEQKWVSPRERRCIGNLYSGTERLKEAGEAFAEALQIYRGLAKEARMRICLASR
jgi:hypothetical protein